MSANAAKAQALQKLIRAVETGPLRPIGRRLVLGSPRIRCWMDALDALPPPCSVAGRSLIASSRRFALTPWAQAAIDAGWSDGDLFGLDDGLVPLALTRGAPIVAITSDTSELRTGCAAMVERSANGRGNLT